MARDRDVIGCTQLMPAWLWRLTPGEELYFLTSAVRNRGCGLWCGCARWLCCRSTLVVEEEGLHCRAARRLSWTRQLYMMWSRGSVRTMKD